MGDVTMRPSQHHLIASDRVEGTAVYGRDGEKLGTIQNFMVDKVSGRAEFAVLVFGGLFGLGHSHYPIPWSMLRYRPDLGGYAVDLDKATLADAPRYEAIQPDYDGDYDDMVRTYYARQPGPFI